MTRPEIVRVAEGLRHELQRHLTDDERQALALVMITFPTARLGLFEANTRAAS